MAKKNAVLFLEACALGDLKSSKPDNPLLKFLTEGNINVRIQDNVAEMPLHKLARMNVTQNNRDTFETCVSLLIEKTRSECEAAGRLLRQDINHQDKNGKSPLYMAVEHKNISMIKMLFRLEKKEAPDPLLVSRPMNWTVLHVAVQADDLELLETLVQFISLRV